MQRASRFLLYAFTVGAVLAMGDVHARYIGHYAFTGTSRFGWSIAYIGLLSLAAYGVGLPDLPRNAYAAMWLALGANVAAAVGISLTQLVVGQPVLPRFVIFWSAAFLVPLYALCGFVAARGRKGERRRDRVVAVLDADDAATLQGDMARNPERRATLAMVIPPAEARVSADGTHPLTNAGAAASGTVVVLDRAAQADDSIVAQAADLHRAGVRFRTLSLFYDEWLGKLPVSELERVSLMFDIGEIHRARYSRMKRVVSTVLALVGCVVLLVAIPVVAAVDLVANRGPLFYRQRRVGRWGKEFTILKFRTMRPGAAGEASTDWTADRDPRVTPGGRLLRVTHLDEIPQMINVLRGDLAFVGPRPEQPRYVQELTEKIPFYDLRHLVRPGITGWAQVKYPYGANELDALEKLQYEFYYLRHQSLTLDVRIIGRSLRSVLGRGGR